MPHNLKVPAIFLLPYLTNYIIHKDLFNACSTIYIGEGAHDHSSERGLIPLLFVILPYGYPPLKNSSSPLFNIKFSTRSSKPYILEKPLLRFMFA